MNEQILEAMKEAIEVAYIVKAKGHDLFVNYYSHVNQLDLKFYLGGWDSDKVSAAEGSGADLQSMISLDGITAPVDPAATIREAIASILETVNTQK